MADPKPFLSQTAATASFAFREYFRPLVAVFRFLKRNRLWVAAWCNFQEVAVRHGGAKPAHDRRACLPQNGARLTLYAA